VALRAVFFDVGETLVDEERWWRVLAERSALQPHVVWAALGVTIERGEEHDALWRHLGIDRPATWWDDLPYELGDLYPDAVACLGSVRALGMRVGIVGNQTATLEQWVRQAALPADVISSSASLGVRKPDPRFFRRVVDLAGCSSGEVAYVGASTTTSFQRSRPASSRCTCGAGRGGASNRRPPLRSQSTRSRSCRTR